MINDANKFFSVSFKEITANDPYPWQQELFIRFVEGKIPEECAIPTGLGKTSVLNIWLIALAWQLMNNGPTLPRRLVYVVDRRTVVDQSTQTAVGLANKLINPSTPALTRIASALKQLTDGLENENADPLAVSTLRGQMADNEEWKQNPARPAIIIGTVDMIGSKLLFSGYGDGRWKKSFHAGLLGQDVLLVHDETHLSPAFHQLIKKIAVLQTVQQSRIPLKSFRVMGLSATPGIAGGDESRIDISEKDKDIKAVRDRLFAEKRLVLNPIEKISDGVEIAKKALSYEGEGVSVIVYVKPPALAQKIFKIISSQIKDDRVLLLTGRIRGHERDRLVDHPVFLAFQGQRAKSHLPETLYLVSTSAGEVGVDLDADHGICDLSTLDSLIQRFGRMNRSGGRICHIDLFCETSEKNPLSNKDIKVLELIKTLPEIKNDVYLASPAEVSNLTQRADYAETTSSLPYIRPLEGYLLDIWSCTSLMTPYNLPVAPWLHGLVEDESPECRLAWREDIPSESENIEAWLEAYPIKTREIARLSVYEILKDDGKQGEYIKTMQNRLKEHGDFSGNHDAILIAPDNSIQRINLQETSSFKGNKIAFSTLILPCAAGGLNLKTGQPDEKADGDRSLDVADEKGIRERYLIKKQDAVWIMRNFSEEVDTPMLGEPNFQDTLKTLEKQTGLRVVYYCCTATDINDEISSAIVYLCKKESRFPDGMDISSYQMVQKLDDHLNSAEMYAETICHSLDITKPVADAIKIAMRYHDQGKNRKCWQMGLGNPNLSIPLAKYPAGRGNWRLNHGFRHELGSCLDLLNDENIMNHSQKELILHLIASHHGYARPDFSDIALSDPEHTLDENHQFNHDAILRFEMLQREYGWWGLAYLEALIKSSDVKASKGK